MGTITRKKIKGKIYYYYIESKRVDGKPKHVNQKYLGTAEKLLEYATNSGKSLQEQILYSDEVSFGAAALLYDLGMRIGIPGLIDSVVPKRQQGVSVGTYVLIAAINRVVAPTSTRGLQEWFESTSLPYITAIRPSLLTPQNFWNNTNISKEQLEQAEDAITKRILYLYGIDTEHLIYDATNFFTYIDTMNPSELAKRGHDKAKRKDLKTVGLAMIITPEFSMPLLSEAYPGNRADSTQFSGMMAHLKQRYVGITGKDTSVTVVFDRGNNSEDNLGLMESEDDGLKIHFIGGIKKNQIPELFSVSKSEYAPLECPESVCDKYKDLTVYRMRTQFLGREVTAVIINNPELQRGQEQGININKGKTEAELMDIQSRLLRRARGEITKGKKPTVESVTKAVDKVLKSREYMADIFEYEILENDGYVYLTFTASEEKMEEIRQKHLGKSAFFTDRHELSNYEIISAYRSAWHLEAAFRQMKDTDFLTVRPIFHWTDQKIRVHLFTCVLAYRLCAVLQKELSDKGITCTIDKVLTSMVKVNRVTTFYGNLEKPKKVESFIGGDELAKRIEEEYHLKGKYYNS